MLVGWLFWTKRLLETVFQSLSSRFPGGWLGGAMVLRPTLSMIVGQGPTALVVGAGGGCLDIFTLIYLFSSLSPSLWETARYRLKYGLRGLLNQTTNQPTVSQRQGERKDTIEERKNI